MEKILQDNLKIVSSKHDHEEEVEKMSAGKKIIFSLMPLVVLIIFLEITLMAGYFYKQKGWSLATVRLARKIQVTYFQRKLENPLNQIPANAWDEFYGPRGEEILENFKKQYEENFEKLATETKNIKSELIMLYIPVPSNKGHFSREKSRQFFRYLSTKYGTRLLDTTGLLTKYPEEYWSLLPENDHLSRFGNQILADYLANFLKNNDHRSDFHFVVQPVQLGDLTPGNSALASEEGELVYRVNANKQGFRNNFDLEFPKQKQRILFLGDSFTYGPYVSNYGTFPEILNQKFSGEKEFINAGIAGYTITDEVGLFLERAKYAEPDITILQVLDNDLYGLFYFKKNQFDRQHKKYEPTGLETYFLNKIK